jgi:hypothetical protein
MLLGNSVGSQRDYIMLKRYSFLLLVGAWVLVGCGGAEIGEACEEVGSSAECVAMAICTNDDGDTAFCRQICDEHEDCPTGESCNGVSGSSTKSCQPDI